jgi:hypothetical protein
MKLYIELLLGVAVGSTVYVVTRHLNAPEPTRSADAPALQRGNGGGTQRMEAKVPVVEHKGTTITYAASSVNVPPSAPRDARAEYEQRAAMNALKNAIITSTSEDMHRRNADVLTCARSLDLAGPEKLRFSVPADSSKGSADFGPWRFREIIDGEALPDSFAACAERALGQGGHVIAGPDVSFPEYRGEVEFVYTLPAPQ